MKSDVLSLPDGCELGYFTPVAHYDKHMDSIRVITHDRSVAEVRVSEAFTLHRCNHAGPHDPTYVGFTLKGVRHLFNQVGISVEGVHTVAEILDALVKQRPVASVSALAYFVLKDYEEIAGSLSVDMSEEHSREAA